MMWVERVYAVAPSTEVARLTGTPGLVHGGTTEVVWLPVQVGGGPR